MKRISLHTVHYWSHPWRLKELSSSSSIVIATLWVLACSTIVEYS